MKRNTIIRMIAVSILFVLSACAGATGEAIPSTTPAVPTDIPAISTRSSSSSATLIPTTLPTELPSTPAAQKTLPIPTNTPKVVAPPDLSRTDSQGQVTVTVIPINLVNLGDTLTFDVSMNTHSVDLSMDLSKLAKITADNGKSAQAIKWDGPRGGHHVQGKLTFSAGEFSGAKKITLTINNVDVPSRVFSWMLVQ
jgi:hypothetical protein